MATHSSVLSWRIPGMGEPGGLPSKGKDDAGTCHHRGGFSRQEHWSGLPFPFPMHESEK